MTLPQPAPQPVDLTLPDYNGPYDATINGACACHGAPVNALGRCEPLNIEARQSQAGGKP